MIRVAALVSIAFLAVACAGGVATPTLLTETPLPPTATPEPTSTPGPTMPTSALSPTVPLEPAPSMMHYKNFALGFAVEYPYGWEVTITTPSGNDPLGRPYEAVEFVSDLYAGGHQAFGRYGITVAACPA